MTSSTVSRREPDADPGAAPRGGRRPPAWSEAVERVDRRGTVYVRLRNEQRSLQIRVSAPGAQPTVLVRGEFGDVSYCDAVELEPAQAAAFARAYATRLNSGGSRVPSRLPHLAVAAAAGRAPGSCRAHVGRLWARDTGLPSTRETLQLDPAGLVEFLAPELRIDAETSDGFVLRAVRVASPGGGGAACVLEFEPPADAQVADPLLIDVGTPQTDGEQFGALQLVTLAPRAGAESGHDSLAPAVARLCSWLVALIELKQAPGFAVTVPNRPARDIRGARGRDVRSTEATGSHPPDAVAPLASAGAASAPAPGALPAPGDEVDTHRFNLLASGFTILRQVVAPPDVAALAEAVDRALEATGAAVAAGQDLAYTFYDEATYRGTRCVYCWGDACVRLLDAAAIGNVAERVIGPHKLFDMSALRALPSGSFAVGRTEWWHRDIDVFPDTPQNVRYLWFFVLLDAFTADNGATWVVPGSQRIPNAMVPKEKEFPTRVQLLGEAGDVIVINPSALHTVGHNVTDRPRTMINVSICHRDVRPLMDHWSIAGPAIQAHASPRVRSLLGADARPPDPTWSVLPDGWVTARRATDGLPPEGALPTEQQGYQRQHHTHGGVLLPDRPGNRAAKKS